MITKVIPMPDIFLECKGLVALVYNSVMRLEDAYRNGNHKEKSQRLKEFKQYRNFMAGQLEGSQLTIIEKISIYNQVYEMCLKILSHEREYYKIYHIVYNKTKHYASRCLTQIHNLEDLLHEKEELETAILIKEVAIAKLLNMRHHYQLVIDGISYSINNMNDQIKTMRDKIKDLEKE